MFDSWAYSYGLINLEKYSNHASKSTFLVVVAFTKKKKKKEKDKNKDSKLSKHSTFYWVL